MAVTVVAVAEAALVRAGISATLRPREDIALVGTAASAAEAEPLVARLCPDVALIEHELGDAGGLDVAARLRRTRPALGLVLLGPHDDHLIVWALQAGISAYVLRSTPVDELLAAIRHAAVAPGSFAGPDLAGVIARRRGHGAPSLSDRERQVLTLLAGGLSTQRISGEMGVSESTVKTYLSRVYDKLGVRGRADAVAAASHAGLLRR